MYGGVSNYRGAGLLDTIGGVAGTVLNKTIDFLPVEVHLPGGYQWCGPGTNVQTRLARGDLGINKLDYACRDHDLAYEKYKDSKNRSAADRVLAERAWERVKASDSSLGEKGAAWLITNVMKAKSKLGSGLSKTKKPLHSKKNVHEKHNIAKKNKQPSNSKKKGEGLYLRPYKGSGKNSKKKGEGLYLRPYKGSGKNEKN